MTLKTKHCNGCGEDKELTEFNVHKNGKRTGKLVSQCKECCKRRNSAWYAANTERANAASRAWWKSNLEKSRKLNRDNSYKHGSKPALENKSSTTFLGCVVAETVLSHEFPGFKRMPNCNPGYDYECPKGYKIDVKSACRRHRKNGTDNWGFSIKKNKVPNYFLFLAFDNRENLNPEHVWLIPGDVVNEKIEITITDLPEILIRWSQYERSLKNVLKCCSKLRNVVCE